MDVKTRGCVPLAHFRQASGVAPTLLLGIFAGPADAASGPRRSPLPPLDPSPGATGMGAGTPAHGMRRFRPVAFGGGKRAAPGRVFRRRAHRGVRARTATHRARSFPPAAFAAGERAAPSRALGRTKATSRPATIATSRRSNRRRTPRGCARRDDGPRRATLSRRGLCRRRARRDPPAFCRQAGRDDRPATVATRRSCPTTGTRSVCRKASFKSRSGKPEPGRRVPLATGRELSCERSGSIPSCEHPQCQIGVRRRTISGIIGSYSAAPFRPAAKSVDCRLARFWRSVEQRH